MSANFFAMLSRLKYIQRWALMRNTQSENLSDHTVQVCFIAHCLAVIGNKRLGKEYNADRCAVLALYHDTTEILTGDMPTPIKYKNETIRNAYKDVEKEAATRLLKMLPTDIGEEYYSVYFAREEDSELLPLVKAADKISALVKCIEEKNAGNTEFKSAEKENLRQIKELKCPEADIFLKEFLDSYSLSLDELTKC